jgi:hypothetical protein
VRSVEPACRTDAEDQRIYLLIRGQDPDGASPKPGNRPKGAPHGAPFFLGDCAAMSRKVQTCESVETGRESPGRLRPTPQTTDTVVPKRPWSFLASSWARAMGM